VCLGQFQPCCIRFTGQLGEDEASDSGSGVRMSRNIKSTLDNAIMSKQEAEAKLAAFEEKVKSLEEDNQNMKNQVE